jgi:hypothetical protein
MRFAAPSKVEIEHVERAIGYKLPTALLVAYASRGNGGFGPEYGLLGLGSGHTTDQCDTALDLYMLLSTPDPEDSGWAWPATLFPILHVGCAIYHCVSLVERHNPVIQFDPNPFAPGDDWSQAFSGVSPSLESWLGGL